MIYNFWGRAISLFSITLTDSLVRPTVSIVEKLTYNLFKNLSRWMTHSEKCSYKRSTMFFYLCGCECVCNQRSFYYHIRLKWFSFTVKFPIGPGKIVYYFDGVVRTPTLHTEIVSSTTMMLPTFPKIKFKVLFRSKYFYVEFWLHIIKFIVYSP